MKTRYTRDAELVAENLPLVRSIARALARRLPPSFEFSDLVGVGNIALLEAVRRYKPDLYGNAPFASFARQRIRGAMLDATRRRNYTEATRPPLADAPEPAAESSIELEIDRKKMRARLDDAIGWLPPAEQRVIELHYGSAEPTLGQVALALGISPRAAGEIHAAALVSLRARFRHTAAAIGELPTS